MSFHHYFSSSLGGVEAQSLQGATPSEKPGFDSRCDRPLPTGLVGVRIMRLAETEVMVSLLCLVCAALRIVRRQSWDQSAIPRC